VRFDEPEKFVGSPGDLSEDIRRVPIAKGVGIDKVGLITPKIEAGQ